MKLSRRGKHTKRARRGRHTKRAGKHHTRRIKNSSKQYKRTYRKNNRKLKHNKRIQRGGVITWYDDEGKRLTKDILLKYKKLSQLFGNGETKPFNITLELIPNADSISLDYKLENNKSATKIFYGKCKVTMQRLSDDKTTVEKTFVVYFALYGFQSSVTYSDGRVKDVTFPVVVYSSDENFSTRSIIDKTYMPCYGLNGITDETNQKYDFSCGKNTDKEFAGNRDFVFSLIKEMCRMSKMPGFIESKDSSAVKEAVVADAPADAPAVAAAPPTATVQPPSAVQAPPTAAFEPPSAVQASTAVVADAPADAPAVAAAPPTAAPPTATVQPPSAVQAPTAATFEPPSAVQAPTAPPTAQSTAIIDDGSVDNNHKNYSPPRYLQVSSYGRYDYDNYVGRYTLKFDNLGYQTFDVYYIGSLGSGGYRGGFIYLCGVTDADKKNNIGKLLYNSVYYIMTSTLVDNKNDKKKFLKIIDAYNADSTGKETYTLENIPFIVSIDEKLTKIDNGLV
jgi:hypothetical protein